MRFLFFIVLFIFVATFDVITPLDEYFNRNLASFVGIFDAKCKVNDYCLSLDTERLHTKLFSTKNAYHTEKSHDTLKSPDFHVEDCTPSRIWLLIRHGTRLPTSSAIERFSAMEKLRDRIVGNLEKLQAPALCTHDLNALRNWNWNNSITMDQANNLVEQGYNELRAIASNYKRNLPNLFQKPYDINHFHFRHTNTERTRSSYRAFVNELFGKSAHKKINAETPTHRPDVLLKAYANCPLWRNQKKKLKQSDSEAKKFEKTDTFQKLISDVNSRLGFNGTLEAKMIRDIYGICRYESAWRTDKASVWCSLLTPSQVYVLEYQEDLNYFYKSGHGSTLNKNIKCFAMQDMLNRLSIDNEPAATVYFSHSAAVQLFLTALGALKDDVDLKADNFAQTAAIRKWRTSKVSPFAANIGIVRYKCPRNDKVKLFLNEKPLQLDWCTSNGECDWHDFQQKYTFYANVDCGHVFCK